MSLRKFANETSVPSADPKFQTKPAQSWNARSCVIPRSKVIASNLFRPGDLWAVEGSPPARCSTTSVVRFRPVSLLPPYTYWPSHFRRNLKFLYGSRRFGFTGNGIGDDDTGFLLTVESDQPSV